MVADLVTHLKLPTKDFPMGAPKPVFANCNLFYLRGRHLRLHELADPDKVPYNLAWSERGLGPTNLQVQVMNNIYPGMGNLSLCDLMKLKVFGKPLWHYGFWDLMYRVLSNEGYQFMKDAGGYDANVANANAVTQLPATEYGDTTQFLTLRDGYDQLPITLADRFNQMPGGLPKGSRVLMNHRLAAIEIAKGTRRVPVHAHLQADGDDRSPHPAESGRRRHQGAREESHPRDAAPVAGARRERVLRASLAAGEYPVGADPERLQAVPGLRVTVVALTGPGRRPLGHRPADSPDVLLRHRGRAEGRTAVHELAADGELQRHQYRAVLEGIGERRCRTRATGHRCLEPGVTTVMPAMEFPATEQMVQIANRQVAEVHALPEIPMPYSAVYHTWNEDPYGGGWHEWKANYRLDEIMCRMRKPVPEHDIHIVGEAYSYGQGWVEGALDTAESTLQDFFGLKRPAWLKKGTRSCRTPVRGAAASTAASSARAPTAPRLCRLRRRAAWAT